MLLRFNPGLGHWQRKLDTATRYYSLNSMPCDIFFFRSSFFFTDQYFTDQYVTEKYNCSADAVCNNAKVSYNYTSKPGYSGDGRTGLKKNAFLLNDLFD